MVDYPLKKAVNISVNDINEVATDIILSTTNFDENIGSGAKTLSTTDQDADDSYTYSLINGEGDSDNDSFTIDGNKLKINYSPDETKSSYFIRLVSTDSGGLSFEKAVNIDVMILMKVKNLYQKSNRRSYRTISNNFFIGLMR